MPLQKSDWIIKPLGDWVLKHCSDANCLVHSLF